MGHLRVKYLRRHQLSGATYYDRWVKLERIGPVGCQACRIADAVNYGRQVVRLVASWSFYALNTYVTSKQMQHTAAGG